ncbi:hypothetical protein [Microbispora rosea]|uniref:hypothetical protein n=1 Tax=Microbispora rosea TaxID=58117 RepID=UPI0037A97D28
MAQRMIKVRSKLTGDTTLVSEKAFGLFAGNYERLDQPPAPAPQASETAAPPSAPSTPTPRTTAPKPKE